MSSAIWVALGRSDDTALATAIKSASAEELFAADESGTTPLQHAIMAAKYECAKALLGASGALGVPPLELTLWERIQADKLPSKDADGEEVEPKDVEAEEYQTELAAELLADLDPAEAGYLIKAIIKIGYYVGGRATVEEHEMAFDTQVAERRGFGVCMLPGGDVYAGEYSGGLREGSGALKTKAGTAYVGKWLAGKRHGQGSMTYSDGGVYTGWWAYGKRHGQGTFTYPNKDSYVGAFHAGVKHGAGKYTSADTGAIYEGTWKNGSLVASKLIFTSADNTAFYGKFDKAGRPVGKSAFAFGNGNTVGGEYVAEPIEETEDGEAPTVVPSEWRGSEYTLAEASTDHTLKTELTTVKPTVNMLIMGAPGSGKGTQCEKIVADFGLVHISTGALLRLATEDADNEFGQQAKECMENGELVPDELITNIVVQRTQQEDCKEQGWLLDGFPRTQKQAEDMEKYFLIPNKCVFVDVPEDKLVERICGRRMDPETEKIYHMTYSPPVTEDGSPDEEVIARLTQRGDDTEDALKNRLVTFNGNKDNVLRIFNSISKTVDGNKDPAEVYADLKAFLDA